MRRLASRLAGANEFVANLEAARADYDRQIREAEAALATAKDRAAREAKAEILDTQATALSPIFEEYLEVSSRFAQALAGIEGMFDAHAAGGLILQTRNELEGARDSIFGQMRRTAGELRKEPPPRSPDPPKLRADVLPRFMGDRSDPHEPWLSGG